METASSAICFATSSIVQGDATDFLGPRKWVTNPLRYSLACLCCLNAGLKSRLGENNVTAFKASPFDLQTAAKTGLLLLPSGKIHTDEPQRYIHTNVSQRHFGDVERKASLKQ